MISILERPAHRAPCFLYMGRCYVVQNQMLGLPSHLFPPHSGWSCEAHAARRHSTRMSEGQDGSKGEQTLQPLTGFLRFGRASPPHTHLGAHTPVYR